MQTITIGKGRYTIRDGRTDFMSQVLKTTGKHKRVKATPDKRYFPKTGESMSTRDYVHAYYEINVRAFAANNSLGRPYDPGAYTRAINDFFQPLSTHLTVPQGFDGIEVEG
jgi:hypothetical protein